jgi:hypothetical protein
MAEVPSAAMRIVMKICFTRLRACCTVHWPVGWAVTPPIGPRRPGSRRRLMARWSGRAWQAAIAACSWQGRLLSAQRRLQ